MRLLQLLAGECARAMPRIPAVLTAALPLLLLLLLVVAALLLLLVVVVVLVLLLMLLLLLLLMLPLLLGLRWWTRALGGWWSAMLAGEVRGIDKIEQLRRRTSQGIAQAAQYCTMRSAHTLK